MKKNTKDIFDKIVKTKRMLKDLTIRDKIIFLTELTGTFLASTKIVIGIDFSEMMIEDIRQVMHSCLKNCNQSPNCTEKPNS